MWRPSLLLVSPRTFVTGILRYLPLSQAALQRYRLRLNRHELRLGELCKAATQPLQFFERAHFDDTAAVEHQDTRRIPDSGEPVGDYEGGAVLHHFVECRLQLGFGRSVELVSFMVGGYDRRVI